MSAAVSCSTGPYDVGAAGLGLGSTGMGWCIGWCMGAWLAGGEREFVNDVLYYPGLGLGGGGGLVGLDLISLGESWCGVDTNTKT